MNILRDEVGSAATVLTSSDTLVLRMDLLSPVTCHL